MNNFFDSDYKVGIYLRLSREDEKLGESGSISVQREMLLNYIRDNNLYLTSNHSWILDLVLKRERNLFFSCKNY